MKMQNISKENIGLVGEYLVAAELCKRGIYAQLTLGNHKKTDLLIETDDGVGCVSVKSKRCSTWPRVKGIWKECDLIVFVDFKGKSIDDKPDFYILNINQWKQLMKKIQKQKEGSMINKSTNTIYWENEEGDITWEGCQISVSQVREHKNKWPTSLTVSL